MCTVACCNFKQTSRCNIGLIKWLHSHLCKLTDCRSHKMNADFLQLAYILYMFVDYAQLVSYTTQHGTVLIIFLLSFQTVTIARTLSVLDGGASSTMVRCSLAVSDAASNVIVAENAGHNTTVCWESWWNVWCVWVAAVSCKSTVGGLQWQTAHSSRWTQNVPENWSVLTLRDSGGDDNNY